MQKWEYALFGWGPEPEDLRRVVFTTGTVWDLNSSDEYWAVLGRLGDEGWEMVAQVNTWSLMFKRPKLG
jgi:hypothetical protein